MYRCIVKSEEDALSLSLFFPSLSLFIPAAFFLRGISVWFFRCQYVHTYTRNARFSSSFSVTLSQFRRPGIHLTTLYIRVYAHARTFNTYAIVHQIPGFRVSKIPPAFIYRSPPPSLYVYLRSIPAITRQLCKRKNCKKL